MVTLLQHVIVNANYFHGYVSMMQINRFQFQFQFYKHCEVADVQLRVSAKFSSACTL